MALNPSYAGQIVKAALESGSIKLLGPTGTTDHAKRNAEADAAYLVKLIEGLTEKAEK